VNTPQTLQELAQLVIDHQGTSARQIAAKAEKEGLKLTYTTLNQMRNGTYKSDPREDTLRALAKLAGVSNAVAFAAAGKNIPGLPLADELPPGSDNLSPRSRKVVVDMLRVLIDLESSENEQQDTQPDQQPDLHAVGGQDDHSEGSESEQMTPLPSLEEAAHPDFELEADRFDRAHGDIGEESQDPDHA
jgi:hypothetical protein